MNSLIIFGERIKDLIFDNKISVETLANELSTDKSSVYKWLRNEEIPTLENLIKIADYFNSSIDFLLGRSSEYIFSQFKKCPPFNLQLQNIIKNKHISEYRICKDTKISRANFYMWKKSIHLPQPESLIRLADYFDCSIDYLIGRED